MGRKRIDTKYRTLYTGKKLDKMIAQCNTFIELRYLWNDYIETARAERTARRLNNRDIIKQCDRFIANIKGSINGDDDLLKIVFLKHLQADIELEKGKLERKMLRRYKNK